MLADQNLATHGSFCQPPNVVPDQYFQPYDIIIMWFGNNISLQM